MNLKGDILLLLVFCLLPVVSQYFYYTSVVTDLYKPVNSQDCFMTHSRPNLAPYLVSPTLIKVGASCQNHADPSRQHINPRRNAVLSLRGQ